MVGGKSAFGQSASFRVLTASFSISNGFAMSNQLLSDADERNDPRSLESVGWRLAGHRAPKLKQAFTRTAKRRRVTSIVWNVFEMIGKRPQTRPCEAINSIVPDLRSPSASGLPPTTRLSRPTLQPRRSRPSMDTPSTQCNPASDNCSKSE